MHYFCNVVLEVAFFLVGEEDVLKFCELNLRLLSRFAHNVKLVYQKMC